MQLTKRHLTTLSRIVQHCPVTTTFVATFVTIGIIVGGWWTPVIASPEFSALAYGLPAFADGHWWAVFTGSLVANDPFDYALTTASFIGVGIVEWHLGSRRALAIFSIAQLGTLLVTSAFLASASALPAWGWAAQTARTLDTGPSGGTVACIAVATGLLAPPWRVRGWLILLATLIVPLLSWGSIADVEHLIAALGVLVVVRPFQFRRVSIEEQRFIACIAVLGLAAFDIFSAVVQTYGPFGDTTTLADAPLLTSLNICLAAALAFGLLHGRRWAWWTAIICASLNVLLGAAIGVSLLIVVPAMPIGPLRDHGLINVSDALIWSMVLALLVAIRRAYRGVHSLDEVDGDITRADVESIIKQFGGGSTAWMATWQGMQHAVFPSGLVTYQLHHRVAIALGTALGPRPERRAANAAFIEAADQAGVTPCFFNVSADDRQWLPAGWKAINIADDMVVGLDDLKFTGKRWGDVRTAVNRARREHIDIEFLTWRDAPLSIRSQLVTISASWVAHRQLPEMGFTLGSLTEAKDDNVRLAVATTATGRVEGFISWLPIYSANQGIVGWTLDLMRRRPDGFPTVMEFLIGTSLRTFSAEGATIASLSGSPLSHSTGGDVADPLYVATLIDRAAQLLEPAYGFQSLQFFKRKFNPTPHQTYLMYRSHTDLASIILAITRAYLPDASLRDLASAGFGIVRHRHHSTTT